MYFTDILNSILHFQIFNVTKRIEAFQNQNWIELKSTVYSRLSNPTQKHSHSFSPTLAKNKP